ncbi:hypothetical protein F4861DRAFT_209490 [Xylaria intraflava]|nr:hypothetical protein F4861DRAFT_209490 [Xylaria intraflava]
MSGDGAGSSDSDETIDDLPANNKGALSDNTLEEASQLSADPGAQGTRQSPRKMAPIDKKAEKKQLTYSEQCELNRERDASARAREGAHFDALLKKRYEEYMQRSRSNLARAVKLYCEREERKARQPWPQLERGKKSLEAMKRVGLDPELAQEMEARKKGAAEMAKSGPVKQKSVKSAPAKRCKGASTKLPVDPEKGAPPMRQTRYKLRHQASQASSVSNNELREAPTTTAPGSNLESAASDEQPESSTSQSADPDPLRIPGKRKRRTNAENLASDLGEKWMLDASESRRLRPRRT